MLIKKSYTLLLFIFIVNTIWAQGNTSIPNIDSVDTPTAVTLPRATYDISILGYNNGGLLTKAIIGLHDNIYLGASFDIENAIGSKEARLNIPGVIAKIKITDGFENNPFLVSIGYDSFYSGLHGKNNGNTNPYNRVIYGPYAVFTKPLFIGGWQQNLHIGVRTPIQPDVITENTDLFASFDFPIGAFVPIVEIERIYFDSNRSNEILANLGLRFNLFDSFAIELDFMFAKNERPNRMISFEYMDSF